jgi:hypothetical protein
MTEMDKKRTSHSVPNRGPRWRSVPVDRAVKIYPVSEHELTTVGTFTFVASFCVGIGSASLGASVAVLLNVLQESDPRTKNLSLVGGIIVVLVAIALVFYGAGIACAVYRRSEWNKIKSEAIQERVTADSRDPEQE